tara:strand:- start:194 stop:682 length:489 start_codon:yes stop_codon:yes gene_type:complete
MITQEQLKELLHYNPDTGIFSWLNGKPTGYVVGGLTDRGYRRIKVCGKLYRAHRLAWLYTNGLFPKDQIDHINGVKDDNRIINLRAATHAENQHNQKIPINNTSGFKGVSWNKIAGKWGSQIYIAGKRKHLGYFTDKVEAHKTYCAAADKYFGKFANYGVTV